MQSATSLLLTAVLLACPHVCRWQGEFASADGGKKSSAAHCPFCCPSSDEKAPLPQRPTDNRIPATDCICKGAICGAADATPAIEVEQPTDWLDSLAIVAAAAAPSGNSVSFDESAHATSPIGGRAMRLLMASLRF